MVKVVAIEKMEEEVDWNGDRGFIGEAVVEKQEVGEAVQQWL